jgi:hypothetical protein
LSSSPRSKSNKGGTSVRDQDNNNVLKGTDTVENDEGDAGADAFLTPEYSNNERLILGPVDFFRLFVPKLPETSIPEAESSRKRMENMLHRRKRVARASVLVQAYARARTLANRGWQLGKNTRFPDNYLKRRLAFDENADNKLHDAKAKNEYYEATVSRDVICHVRGAEHLKSYSWWKPGRDEGPASVSLYQGYTLVGMHAFHWPNNDESLSLHYTKDPLRCIPSLRELIESNPDLDFFVNAFFPEAQHSAIIQVYVRSLPKGIDPKFDTVVSDIEVGIHCCGDSLNGVRLIFSHSFWIGRSLCCRGQTFTRQQAGSYFAAWNR